MAHSSASEAARVATTFASSPLPAYITDNSDVETTSTISSLTVDSDSSNVPFNTAASPSAHKAANAASVPTEAGLEYHESYYIRDDMVELRIENTMFRVPRFLLTAHSSVLRELIRCGDEESSNLPIHFSSVTVDSFVNLLHVLDPLQLHSAQHFEVDQWVSVLAASTELEFHAARQQAVDKLAEMASPIDKIMLARLYGLNAWLPDAYIYFCKREGPLTLEEARRIPLEDVVNIGQARHEARQGTLQWTNDSSLRVLTVLYRDSQAIVSANQEPLPTPLRDPSPPPVLLDVVRGLDMFTPLDALACGRGKQLILSAIDRSDKSVRTIQQVFDLIVPVGLKSWSSHGWSVGGECIALLNEIVDHVGSQFLDESLTDTDGKSFTIKTSLARYMDLICLEQGTYDLRNSDLAISQAGFMGQLYEIGIVQTECIRKWWTLAFKSGKTNRYYENNLVFMRRDHVFFSCAGRYIDVPAVQDIVNEVFEYWNTEKMFRIRSWKAVQPEIQGLKALRARKWN